VQDLSTLSDHDIARRYYGRVYNFCRSLLRDAAEVDDACQEVFLTVARRRGELPAVRRFVPWLFKIALLTCLHLRRQRDRLPAPLSAADTEDAVQSQPPVERTEEASRVQKAAARLPERYRAVLALHYQQGLDHEEIAEVMGVSRGALRVLLHRAVMRLREEVKKR
jgi:RNA polymerase sigma-70 factor (ECF subfamily)